MAISFRDEWPVGRAVVRGLKKVGVLVSCYDPLNDVRYYHVKLKGGIKQRFDTEDDAVAYMITLSEIGDL